MCFTAGIVWFLLLSWMNQEVIISYFPPQLTNIFTYLVRIIHVLDMLLTYYYLLQNNCFPQLPAHLRHFLFWEIIFYVKKLGISIGRKLFDLPFTEIHIGPFDVFAMDNESCIWNSSMDIIPRDCVCKNSIVP